MAGVRGSPRVHAVHGTAQAQAHPPLWVSEVDVSPLVVMQVRDEHGRPIELTGYLETFLPFAKKLLALHVQQVRSAQVDDEYYEPQEQAG